MIKLILKRKKYIFCYFITPKKQKEVQFYFSFVTFKFNFNIMNYIVNLPISYIANEIDSIRKNYHD